MTEEERWQRLREFNEVMVAKRRYDQPPDAGQWIFGFEDVDDEQGSTVRRGIPVDASSGKRRVAAPALRRQHRQEGKRMNEQGNEPFFITEEIEAEMKVAGYVFEPPAHVSTLRLRDVLATLSDDDLAAWPGDVTKEEIKHRRRYPLPNS